MKLRFRGQYTLKGFQAALRRAMEDLAANDIDAVGYVSMYFNPIHEGQKVELLDERGNAIEELVLDDQQAQRTYRAMTPGMTYMAKETFAIGEIGSNQSDDD